MRRARPKQHVRKLKRGRRIIVNRGVKKKRSGLGTLSYIHTKLPIDKIQKLVDNGDVTTQGELVRAIGKDNMLTILKQSKPRPYAPEKAKRDWQEAIYRVRSGDLVTAHEYSPREVKTATKIVWNLINNPPKDINTESPGYIIRSGKLKPMNPDYVKKALENKAGGLAGLRKERKQLIQAQQKLWNNRTGSDKDAESIAFRLNQLDDKIGNSRS